MGLNSVELVMAIEKEFNLAISDSDAASMETPGIVYEYLLKRLMEARTIPLTQHEKNLVWQKLKHIVVYQLGVKPEQVTKDVYFVKDLGMN